VKGSGSIHRTGRTANSGDSPTTLNARPPTCRELPRQCRLQLICPTIPLTQTPLTISIEHASCANPALRTILVYSRPIPILMQAISSAHQLTRVSSDEISRDRRNRRTKSAALTGQTNFQLPPYCSIYKRSVTKRHIWFRECHNFFLGFGNDDARIPSKFVKIQMRFSSRIHEFWDHCSGQS
jgi:hypothetical protein